MKDISTDFYGPIEWESESERKKIWLLTISDRFSRYTLVRPTLKPTSNEVVRVLKEKWIKRFGKPLSLLSDNGKQFTSTLLQDYCNENDIVQKFTTPYNPTGNSISERVNGVIGQVLRSYKNKALKEVIQAIERSLNFGYNRNLKCSPTEAFPNASAFDLLKRESLYTKESYKCSEQRLDQKKRSTNNKSHLQEGILGYVENWHTQFETCRSLSRTI